MKLSQTQFESILETLPIGYYFGRNAPVEVTDKDTSYCDLDSETIYVSYPAISQSLAPVKEYDPEAQIRAHVYHELSHLILTPKIDPRDVHTDLPRGVVRDVLNIFEDERIETILRTYYYGVNFWESTLLENPIPSDIPADPVHRFFLAVRLHRYPGEEVKRVAEEIIRKWYRLHAGVRVTQGPTEYFQDVIDFYCKYFLDPSKNSENSEDSKQDDSLQNSGRPEQANSSEQSPTESSSISDIEPTATAEIIESLVKAAASAVLVNPKMAKIKDRVKRIIQTAMNKRANQAASRTGYSGRIDPRLVGDRNYRWFIKGNGDGKTRYSKIKINLFIDSSGSFHSSQNEINAVLAALRELKEELPDFMFDAITMNEKNDLLPKTEKSVHCKGCNNLSPEIFALYKQVQHPQARVANIAVFDGNAWSDIIHSAQKDSFKNMGVFNHPNCIIVSDTCRENATAIRTFAPQAKSILISKDYSSVFINEVLGALERLLA